MIEKISSSIRPPLMSLTGVTEASVDLTERQATIHYDSAIVCLSDLKKAVEDQGVGGTEMAVVCASARVKAGLFEHTKLRRSDRRPTGLSMQE